MGELRRRREGGEGPLLENRGQFGPRQNMLLVPACVPQTHSVKILLKLKPLPGCGATKNILCVGFNVDFLCPGSFCRSSQRTPHFLWTCSQNPNLEMTRQGNIYFHEVGDIKYSSNMQIRFLQSLFVHESWVNAKIVQELHSQSFHPRFLGSKRAPAWALTFLWLARATSELCHRNNQTYYSETHSSGGRE